MAKEVASDGVAFDDIWTIGGSEWAVCRAGVAGRGHSSCPRSGRAGVCGRATVVGRGPRGAVGAQISS